MNRKTVTALATLALVVALGDALRAVDLRNVLTDYTLTSWSRKDGLTGPVWAFAQDADGFLWVGNDDGLVRFDGVRFITWDRLGGRTLPRLSVRALHVSSDGTQNEFSARYCATPLILIHFRRLDLRRRSNSRFLNGALARVESLLGPFDA